MTLQERSEVRFQLEHSEASYWYDVDNNWGRTAHHYFLEDGVFDLGLGEESRYEGSEKVRQFYAWRLKRGERTVRHLMSNFRVEVTGEREATAFYVLSLFGEDGSPVRESRPAILVTDTVCRMTLGDDGRWRIRERVLIPIFKSGIAPTVMDARGQRT